MTKLQLASTTKLREALNECYNEDELKTLCADLGIDYDDLAGGTKQSKVRELIDYLRRREQVRDLIEAVSKQRPHKNWHRLANPQLEQQVTPYSSFQKWLVISAIAISSMLIVILVALLTRELFAISTPQPTPTTLSLAVTSTPQRTAMSFTYPVQIKAGDSGQPLPDVAVTIYVIGQAPLRGITDANGYARILIDSNMANQPARLEVQAQGYEQQTLNIDLHQDTLPVQFCLGRRRQTSRPRLWCKTHQRLNQPVRLQSGLRHEARRHSN